jgi:hypothetical protein
LLINAKNQQGKNENKNTGLFINCMDFVVVRTKINKKKYRNFFCYAWALTTGHQRKHKTSHPKFHMSQQRTAQN